MPPAKTVLGIVRDRASQLNKFLSLDEELKTRRTRSFHYSSFPYPSGINMPIKARVLRALHVVIFAMASLCCQFASADIVLDILSFSGTDSDAGNCVDSTSTFTLADDQIPNAQLLANFNVIDDGAAIKVNGMDLFVAKEHSQCGPKGFLMTVDQTVENENLWLANSNDIARLSTLFDSTSFNVGGRVTQATASTVNYIPTFAVADFTDRLVVGHKTIDIVNYNGSQRPRSLATSP